MTHPVGSTHAAMGGGAYGFVRNGYGRAETHELTASGIESATVYGRGDETVGTVSSLNVSDDGKITEAVIDVGGFLGMGAHTVLVPFNQLTVLRETNGSDLRVYLDTTKDQLKAMPEYMG